MKKLLTATAVATFLAPAAFAGSLETVVGDRIGVHRNGCEVVIYATPRTALFGLLSTNWDYTRAGRECRDALFPDTSGDNDNDNDRPVIDTRPPVDNDPCNSSARCG